MRHWAFLSISFLLLFSCYSKTDKNSNKESKSKKYFDYDIIDYYFNNFEEDKLLELVDNKSKSELDATKFEVIVGEIPTDLTDLTFIGKLEDIGYNKKPIEKSKFKSIDEIFVEKTVSEGHAYACVPIYRDILIFKKNNKVIGVTKVCFGCRIHRIIGTILDTENFGQEGDYERLLKIVRD